ncbi:MAG: Crp/Fnr family transcriptional regulator [Emcibacteraceae bacterium]
MISDISPAEFLKKTILEICPIRSAVLDEFIRLFTVNKIKAGVDLIKEGDDGSCVWFIVSGLLRSYYISQNGEQHNKHFFVPGTFCAPLTSLVAKQPSPVYIGSLKETELLSIDYSRLEQLYLKFPELNLLGRKLVEWAWIGKERRETQLIMLNATDRYKAFQKEFPGLEEQIPQYHIASYLGITPVQLSRIRAKI